MRFSAGGQAPVCEMPGLDDSDPRFAERAVAMLERGEIASALSLCLSGTKKFPDYATGYWVLGRCYESLGKPHEAAEQFLRVNRLVHGFEAVAEALRRVAVGTLQTEQAAPGEEENGVAFMLRQLQNVRRQRNQSISPKTIEQEDALPAAANPSLDGIGSHDTAGGEGTQIVTATLAEIYVQQGKYAEAVAAYRTLIQQRPEEAGRHRERLVVLEKLLQGVDKLGEA